MWSLKYKDIALNSKNDSTSVFGGVQGFSDPALLKSETYAMPKFSTIEKDFWLLDGSFQALEADDENIAFCSEYMSDKNGGFDVYPVMIRTYGHYYTSVGITLWFDINTGDYISNLNIKWYADEELLSDMDFTPDNAEYFCENTVELYNKIVITVKGTCKPYRYAKIARVDDGLIRTLLPSEITELNVLEEISEDGSELAVNVLKFGVVVRDVQYLFQKAQPVELYKDNVLRSSFYLKNSARKSKHLYSAECEDAIGFLETIVFCGGIYNGETVENVINDIMSGEIYDFWLDESLKGYKLYGYIPYTNKRRALQQICFATGAICDTSRNGRIEMYLPDKNEVAIDEYNVIKGGKIITGDYITKIHITEHNYRLESTVEKVYSKIVTYGKNIVIFDKPVDIDSVTTNSQEYGTITEISCNHLVLESNDEFRLEVSAKPYNDNPVIRTYENKRVPYGSADNEKKIENATLVGAYNIESVSERIFNTYTNNKKIETELIVDKYKCGDYVTIKTEWEGIKTARILKIDGDIKNSMYAKAVLQIDG